MKKNTYLAALLVLGFFYLGLSLYNYAHANPLISLANVATVVVIGYVLFSAWR